MPVPMSLADLVQRAAAREPEALDALLRTYYPQVQALVHRELDRDFRKRHRGLMPMLSTGDVVQDVFLGVLDGLATFEATDEQALVRFLTTLVKHRLIDMVRHHEADRRDVRRQIDAPTGVMGAQAFDDPTPSLLASVTEQLDVYREVLATFPAKDKAVLELRLSGETPFATIAEQLGLPSAEAARKVFTRAQARLLVKLRGRGISVDPRTTEIDP